MNRLGSFGPLQFAAAAVLIATLTTACREGAVSVTPSDREGAVSVTPSDDPCRPGRIGRLDNWFQAGSSNNLTALYALLRPEAESDLTVSANQFWLEGCVYVNSAEIQRAELLIYGRYPSVSPPDSPFLRIDLIRGELGAVVPTRTATIKHFRVLVRNKLFQIQNQSRADFPPFSNAVILQIQTTLPGEFGTFVSAPAVLINLTGFTAPRHFPIQ